MERRSISNWQDFLTMSRKSFRDKYRMKKESPFTSSDFTFLSVLGVGGYGRVVKAKHKVYGKLYAIKILEKAKIIKMGQVQHTLSEKRILQSIDFHFIVRLEHFFHDNCYLYIVMPFVLGRELFDILRSLRKFSEETAAFYAAQVVLALEYLHFLHIAFRDLKPENIIVCADGYIKLIDLGYAKEIETQTYTMCGTVEYLAPEIILYKGHGLAVDWWTLGVLIYEMCVGSSPFFNREEEKIFESIVEAHYDEDPLASRACKDIVKRLLQVSPSKRLGNTGNKAADIKSHPWFSRISWLHLLNKLVQPSLKPRLFSNDESSYLGSYEQERLKYCKEDFSEYFSDF